MSQTLNLEVSDDVFAAIRRQAEAAGTTPAHLIAGMLEKQYRSLSESTEQKARERFESHFGEVNLGYSIGVDNEKIDEDLAKTYADSHEAS